MFYHEKKSTVIPADMDPDDAVLLTDVVPTGYQAAEMAGIKVGDTVVVGNVVNKGITIRGVASWKTSAVAIYRMFLRKREEWLNGNITGRAYLFGSP